MSKQYGRTKYYRFFKYYIKLNTPVYNELYHNSMNYSRKSLDLKSNVFHFEVSSKMLVVLVNIRLNYWNYQNYNILKFPLYLNP